MAQKKSTRSLPQRAEANPSFLNQFRFGESYTSLVLGIIVVIAVAVVVTAVTRSVQNKGRLENTNTLSQKTVEESLQQTEARTYTVVPGDHLWGIAEKMYKSGYNWVDIAKANNLTNPNIIAVGTKLTLPKVVSRTVNIPNKIEGTSYTVKQGDYLWNIALRRYADGYRWVDIAKVNKLVNPNIIHAGTILKLP